MENEFLPYEQSLDLKKLDFNEPCFGYYDGNYNWQCMYNGKPEKFSERRMGVSNSAWVGWVSAPLYQQAFRFFREKYELLNHITAHLNPFGEDNALEESYGYRIIVNKDGWKCELLEKHSLYDTYEEAQIQCLKKLIEIVKKV